VPHGDSRCLGACSRIDHPQGRTCQLARRWHIASPWARLTLRFGRPLCHGPKPQTVVPFDDIRAPLPFDNQGTLPLPRQARFRVLQPILLPGAILPRYDSSRDTGPNLLGQALSDVASIPKKVVGTALLKTRLLSLGDGQQS